MYCCRPRTNMGNKNDKLAGVLYFPTPLFYVFVALPYWLCSCIWIVHHMRLQHIDPNKPTKAASSSSSKSPKSPSPPPSSTSPSPPSASPHNTNNNASSAIAIPQQSTEEAIDPIVASLDKPVRVSSRPLSL